MAPTDSEFAFILSLLLAGFVLVILYTWWETRGK